jgi:HK97 family phage major capsid protein
MNLKDLLAKMLAKGFATKSEQAEVATAVEGADDATKAELATEIAEVAKLPEESEDNLDEEALKALVTGRVNEIAKSATEKAFEKMSDELVSKFMAGVKDNRKTAIATPVAKGKFEESKSFFKSLFQNDMASLKAAGYLDTATAGTAGYLVPPAEFIAEVYRIAETEYGVARREMRYIPKSGAGDTITVPALGTSVSSFWTGQGVAKTSTEPSFNLPTITLKKLAAIVPWTDEFEEDMGVNAVQLLATLFAESLAKMEDEAFFKGDGTSGFGGFTGILNNTSVNEVALTSASIEDITAEKLLDMQDETPAGALQGAKYYMHRSVLSIVRKLRENNDGTGAFIYQAPGAGQPATLWNQPVEIVEAMPSVSDDDSETPFVIFGNLKNTCIISDKGNIALKVFDSGVVRNVGNNADLNLITQDMKALRVVRRVGFTVALPAGITVLKTGASS